MNRLIVAVSFGLLATAPLLAQQVPAKDQDDTAVAADSQAAAIVADCSARKFESSIEIDEGGQKRLTRFKLCAAKDSDDAAWVRTLKDARAKIEAHPDISAESKASIAAQLDAEIARVESAAALGSPGKAQPAEPEPVTGTAVPVAPEIPRDPAPAPAQAVVMPRLTIRCIDQGELGDGGPCIDLERHTRLAIRADSDLASNASLRFLRRGDLRVEIALARMEQGQTAQFNLPANVCAGVANSKVQIQVVAGTQVVETLGPYNLRC